MATAPEPAPPARGAVPPDAVELVCTGDELLNGRTLNRHGQTLGARLPALGLRLARETIVPDDAAAIEDAVRAALARASAVVVSGGLGPTTDDLTREAVAHLFGRRIVTDAGALEALERRYAGWGRTLSELSRRQARVVEGFTVLPNSAGAAPGQRLETGGRALFLLPGPPREFLALLEDHVLPILGQRAGAGRRRPQRVFRTCGLPESNAAQALEGIGLPGGGIDVAYCAAPGRVDVRLLGPPGAADAALDATADRVRALLGDVVFTEDDLEEMEHVVGRLLAARGATLAVAESCTGGLIGHRVTQVAGSSAWFLGGVVAYANESKTRDLGVDAGAISAHGAVSEPVARAMAAGVRARFGAACGLAVTGVAGPGGGTPEKPVGTVWMAVADAAGGAAKLIRGLGERSVIKDFASGMALDLLRRRLLGLTV